ncbi:MAG TPA: rRNA maturation RNase YbeY [Candidatus Paceibacterota bacterium]|nr:rRNA maturation RNase YbeY [Candidatus Paceibacterota bacterium]
MTRRKAPVFPFEAALKAALPAWDVSLVFAGPTLAKNLNHQLRKKSYTPNVLSYPTGKKSGELIICLEVAKEQAPEYGMRYAEFVGYLFIHGLLHLKGMAHGSTMERAERQLMSRLAPTYSHATTHRNRNRHRDLPSKGRRR